MSPEEIGKALGEAGARALGEAIAEGIAQGSVDAGLAKMIEKLSDERLKAKSFPDGRYVPPEG